MRQAYSPQFLQHILNQYPNKGKIIKYFLFTSGFENSNYYIQTEEGEGVIKIFDGIGMKKENILFEIELMMFCAKNNLKVPKLCETAENRWYVEQEGKIAIVMEYVSAKNCFKKIISDNIIEQVGEEAGKMDIILRKFDGSVAPRKNYEWDMQHFLLLEKEILLLPKQFDKKIMKNIFDRFRKIKPQFEALPKTIIHNDIAAHNILAEQELKAIIDFSDAAVSCCIQNIAVFLCQTIFNYNWNPEQTNIFLQGYEKHNPLTKEERELLYDLVCTRYATIIIEFNRWNVLYGEDEQRSEYIIDNYNFLQRFLEVGREKFEEIILKKD